MKSTLRILVTSASILALAGLMTGQEKAAEKKSAPAAAKSKILQPQMTVETGSYQAPHGKMGEKSDAVWSATTMGAAVDGKPNPGAKTATLTGEIIDLSCYLQIGKHGEKHRACGQKCIKNGQPIGLLTSDGSVYMLMEEEHDPRRDGQVTFRQAAEEHMGHIMEVTGTLWKLNGYNALYLQGYTKK
jgi:hypothetical protein